MEMDKKNWQVALAKYIGHAQANAGMLWDWNDRAGTTARKLYKKMEQEALALFD